MKKCGLFFLLLLVILAGIGTWGYIQFTQFAQQPVHVTKDQLLTVERGTTGNKLSALLEKEHIVEHATLLPYFLKLQPELNKIKAGTYDLTDVKTLTDLLLLLNSGKEAQFSLTFIEGDTFKTWQNKMKNAPYLVSVLQDKSIAEIFQLLQLPIEFKEENGWRNFEGWLYPDTYKYVPNSTDLALLKRAADRMKRVLEQAWQERDKDLPFSTPYEMLIMASIVEKETALEKERPIVASVFINRLKLKMKLQTDPTVIYGMGDRYNGNIRKKDLEMPTAYNTYVINGLPPTPIAMPSERSLLAVAHPAQTNFLYFVADGSGGHQFSRHFAEHQRAVQQYLRWYHENNRK